MKEKELTKNGGMEEIMTAWKKNKKPKYYAEN